jgi:hypothetical protein
MTDVAGTMLTHCIHETLDGHEASSNDGGHRSNRPESISPKENRTSCITDARLEQADIVQDLQRIRSKCSVFAIENPGFFEMPALKSHASVSRLSFRLESD